MRRMCEGLAKVSSEGVGSGKEVAISLRINAKEAKCYHEQE